jgi:hypothetical protein
VFHQGPAPAVGGRCVAEVAYWLAYWLAYWGLAYWLAYLVVVLRLDLSAHLGPGPSATVRSACR